MPDHHHIYRIWPGYVRSQRAFDSWRGFAVADIPSVEPQIPDSLMSRERACSQAHANVLRAFLATKDSHCVVIEDDVTLVNTEWLGYTSFDYFQPFAANRDETPGQDFSILYEQIPFYGAQGYIASRCFAEAYIPLLEAGGIADIVNLEACIGLKAGSFASNGIIHDNCAASLISEERRLVFSRGDANHTFKKPSVKARWKRIPIKPRSVSFCVLCSNQRRDVEQTLIENLRAIKGKDGEIVLVDCYSEDGLIEWVTGQCGDAIRNGQLQVYQLLETTSFSLPAGKNFALRLANKEIVIKLEPDAFIDDLWIAAQMMTSREFLLCDIKERSGWNQIGLWRNDLERLNGYDESFKIANHVPSENDLIKRARRIGLTKMSWQYKRSELLKQKAVITPSIGGKVPWLVVESNDAAISPKLPKANLQGLAVAKFRHNTNANHTTASDCYFTKPSDASKDAPVANPAMRTAEPNPMVNPPNHKWLVYTSAGDWSNVDYWIEGRREFDLWITYYGNEEGRYKKLANFYNSRKGGKFPNLYAAYQQWPDILKRYEAIMVLDDDIVIDATGISRLFQIRENLDLWLLQPAFASGSKLAHKITQSRPDTLLRYVNFVELTCPLFKKQKLDLFMEVYDPKLVGWGIDWWYMHVLGQDARGKIAIVDEITCVNPKNSAKGGRREIDRLQSKYDRIATWEGIEKSHNISTRAIGPIEYGSIPKKSDAPETTSDVCHLYYARHKSWSGPLKLFKDGRFTGGIINPNGRWKHEEDQSKLILKWYHWPHAQLTRTEKGFAGNGHFLEAMAAEFNGFWAQFDPSRSILKDFTSLPISVCSMFSKGKTNAADLAFSGENVHVYHDGHRFHWRYDAKKGVSTWFAGIPFVQHPKAFYIPLFYHYWVQLPRHLPLNRLKKPGISFVVQNTKYGNLAKRRLALAVYLSKWFTIAAPASLRGHFDSSSKATFYEIDDKLEFISQYRFNLCFENSATPTYLTEKLFQSIYAGAVPLYAGDAKAVEWFEPGSFVDCLKLTPEEVAEMVFKLNSDSKADMIEEKREKLCKVPLEVMTERVAKFAKQVGDWARSQIK